MDVNRSTLLHADSGGEGFSPPPSGDPLAPRIDIVDVAGAGTDAGVAYGEAARDLVRSHLAYVVERSARRKGLSEGTLYERAGLFKPYVVDESPDLAAEIEGIAIGAGIPVEAAWLLQLRAEVSRVTSAERECTSFGTTNTAASVGTLAGQNADLPAFYQDVLVLLRRRIPGRPTVLTLTPAGQVGWHGMNEAGVAVFANFLHSHGWRPGVPRYLFTRIALEFDGARVAAEHLMAMPRGSSRNVLLADETEVLDVELAVDEADLIEAVDGMVVHANHHISDIDHLERADDDYIRNSRIREDTLRARLEEQGSAVDVDGAIAALRDRSAVPDALCRAPEDRDEGDDTITVASTVADVANRSLWISIGPPHVGTYHEYAV
jgi:isopenicillin-N N-acyltransferase like protein